MDMDRKTLSSRIGENTEQMRMIDMHAHLSFDGKEKEELEFRREKKIFTCFSTGTPGEWKQFQRWRSRKEILVSFGLHPWYADRFRVEECREYLDSCDFVGEIGMDSVWCEVPIKLQQKVLEQQLQAAADRNKPVILHTKGQERRIGEIIRDFPGKVCVHWYSGTEKDLEDYLLKDCYFTLGPDVREVCECREEGTDLVKQKGYLRILQEVSLQRLFVETDGISAVAWAKNRQEAKIEEIPEVLRNNMNFAAEQHGCSEGEIGQIMKKNLEEFLDQRRK